MADEYADGVTATLTALLGDTLLSGSGTISTADALKGKESIILYFSAHWCGPCRGFTPMLVAAYKQYKASGGNEAEVVFVSWDRDDSMFKGYFGEMPWLALPFDKRTVVQSLNKQFKVQGIPGLVALGPDGVINSAVDDPRSFIAQHKAAAFPMTEDHVIQIILQQEERQTAALKDFTTIFSSLCSSTGEETTMGHLLANYQHVIVLLGDGDLNDQVYPKLNQIATTLNQKVNKLAVVYLEWTLCDENAKHGPFNTMFYSCKQNKSVWQENIDALCCGQIIPAHGLVIGRDESGELAVLNSCKRCGPITQWGAEGYPWSKTRVAELEAVKKARIAALKEKRPNLQFLKSPDRDGLFANDGKEVKIDTIASGSSDALVGIYFSAHWCGPCRSFTPMLIKCYQELKAAGKSFEVIFVSSDRNMEEFNSYFAEMPWLSLPFPERVLKEDLSEIFEVRGIPTFVLLKPGGTPHSANGRDAITYGAEYFPWGPEEMARGKAAAEKKAAEEQAAAVKAEAEALENQTAKGGPVVKRLRGDVGVSFDHVVDEKRLTLKSFPTLGAPGLLTKAGVLYYEIEVLPSQGIPQIGFASEEFEEIDGRTGDGVGDDAVSWGVDGVRGVKWYDGTAKWPCKWSLGDTIGFASHIDKGKIAVSKNGDWSEPPLGVVFENDKIKSGVYPAFTGQGYSFRYNLNGSSHGPFKYAPPPEEVWAKAPQ